VPNEIVMPRLGWNMERGSIGQWLKNDGDHVEAGEVIFTVEGDKAVQDVEVLDGGILRIPIDSPPPGTEVPVGTLLAYVLQPGEHLPAQSKRAEPAGPPARIPASAVERPAASASGITISPRARRIAREIGVDWTMLTGSGRSGRIVERDVRQAAAELSAAAEEQRISPLAQQLAGELGLDVAALAAHAPGGRIEQSDVLSMAREAIAARHVMTRPSPVSAGSSGTMTAARRTIAERMAMSARSAAAVTLTTEADATEMVCLRSELRDDGWQPVPSYNDLLAKLTSVALIEHPRLNARLEGDAIIELPAIDIGLAVDTDRGLLVPVLRDVQAKSLRQIVVEASALIERARAGKAGAVELQGSTFTITNLGMYDIDVFTPIINPPECAILGVGRIVPKQIVLDAESGRTAIRQMVFLSLTFDHRLVDGAPAARFLQRVKHYIERPYTWLVR
jgi:pyruvate dehydrogenase E2 component (dihydrolipoamide acetyltransferase)